VELLTTQNPIPKFFNQSVMSTLALYYIQLHLRIHQNDWSVLYFKDQNWFPTV